VEYPGLQMVEPDDRMEVVLHHVVPFIGEQTVLVGYPAAIFRA
jgi:hypothetical protein